MTGDSRSDAEVIYASKEFPEEFAEIYSRHKKAVFRLVARRIGVSEAPDVTASVFERAFTIRGRYDTSRSDCLPWLFGIATNILGDRFRRWSRRKNVYITAMIEQVVDPFEEAIDRVVAHQLAESLNMALARLSQRDRDTFLLYALERLSYSEIAEALSIPIGTVGSRINRVRTHLTEHIPDLAQRASSDQPVIRDSDND